MTNGKGIGAVKYQNIGTQNVLRDSLLRFCIATEVSKHPLPRVHVYFTSVVFFVQGRRHVVGPLI